MGILSKAKNKSEWSDELIAYMVDGDIRIDEDVHQEFGMLESREYGWLLRMPSPTPRYEWVAYSDDYPTKKGHSYCVALEPDPVDQMPEFMNWLTIVIVLAASQGTTKGPGAGRTNDGMDPHGSWSNNVHIVASCFYLYPVPACSSRRFQRATSRGCLQCDD